MVFDFKKYEEERLEQNYIYRNNDGSIMTKTHIYNVKFEILLRDLFHDASQRWFKILIIKELYYRFLLNRQYGDELCEFY